MEYHILGPLEVLCEAKSVDIGPRQQRALLALLLVNVNRVVSTERILEELWPDDPTGKERTLWVYISRLRSALEPDRTAHSKSAVLVTRDHGYSLAVEPDAIDSHRFEEAVGRGRTLLRDNPNAAAKEFREAFELWRGDPLEDFTYDDFAQLEITRLKDVRLTAVEDMLDANLRCGLHRDVVGDLEALVRVNPLRERPVGLVMTALYRTGRQADALRAFGRYRRRLGEELGLEPSPELQRIEEQVLLHDKRLEPPQVVGQPKPTPEHAVSNPFKGLHAFSEADVAIFFGRDRLVSDLVRRIGSGNRLLALVGSSGSGKSSVLRAGLIPALRKGAIEGSEGWIIAQMVPGARPFIELEASLLRSILDAPDSLADLLADPENGLLGAALRLLPEGSGQLVLVIDQFEELFSLTESEEDRARFIRNLEVALADPHGRILIVLALRADFYARPLEYSSFGELLGDSVVNTVPLTPDELEAAAEEPAAVAGVRLEPALLARLLGDVAGQSGGLPLFQYALTELFDQRADGLLTAEAYEEMGGVRGALTRRAEELFVGLEDGERAAAKQLFLRLVTIIGDGAWSRRRVQASEIVSIAGDVVDLQTVLDRFGSHRLLTFDSDRTTGSPTVEVAHEALLREWDRLHGWIEQGRDDVVRHARLTAARDEWLAAGEHADYLLTGERLERYEAWTSTSTLQLSRNEQLFIDRAIAHREDRVRVEEKRTARESKLDRQARSRLRGLVVAGIVIAVVGGAIFVRALVGGPQQISVLLGPSGDAGINDLMALGVAAAEREFDIEIESSQPQLDREAELRHVAETGSDLIIVSSDYDLEVERVAPDFPEVQFVAIDPFAIHIERDNITEVSFAVEQSAYLAGYVAALTSSTRKVGFIGAVPIQSTEAARTGFEQGAEDAVGGGDVDIVVDSRYLGPVENPLANAALSETLAYDLAIEMYGEGVDVIYQAAGAAGIGVIRAAEELLTPERALWVIGSDADEYLTVSDLERQVVLTSTLKRYNNAVLEIVRDFRAGLLASGTVVLGLDTDAVGLSREGDHLAAIDSDVQIRQGELESGHINLKRYALRGASWQRSADVTVLLTMDETSCSAEVVDGPAPDANGEVRIAPGSIVQIEYENTTDQVGGLTMRVIPFGLTRLELEQEALVGIPASYDVILGGSFVEPLARTSLAAVMPGSPFVPNCLMLGGEISPSDFPALILVPST